MKQVLTLILLGFSLLLGVYIGFVTLHLVRGILRNVHCPLFSVDHVFPFKFSFIYVCVL